MAKTLFGFHPIEEMLKTRPQAGKLYLSGKNGRNEELIRLASKKGIGVKIASKVDLEKAGGPGARAPLFVASFSDTRPQSNVSTKSNSVELDDFLSDLKDTEEENNSSLVLILDEITDVHNFGAILRSADQFGVDLVISTERHSAADNAILAKTSSGAWEHVPVALVTNLKQAIDKLKEHGFWVYGASMNGTSVNEAKLTGKTAVVMGSEGKGIRPLVAATCDALITIPTRGKIDSLNVSVAAGIILYEIRRQSNFS